MFLCERDRASPLLGRFLVLPACFSYTQVPQRARHHLCTVSIACQCMHGTSILLAAAVRVLHGWEPEAAGSLAISTNTLCLPLFPGLLPTRRRHQHCVPITGECCRAVCLPAGCLRCGRVGVVCVALGARDQGQVAGRGAGPHDDSWHLTRQLDQRRLLWAGFKSRGLNLKPCQR